MSTPTNKSEFIEFCLRKLGKPVIQINVASEQIDDRVTQAVYRWRERHYRGSELVFGLARIRPQDFKKGYLLMPPDTVGIANVYHVSNTSNIFSIDFLMRLGELQALSKTQYAGINYYFTIKMHLELLNEMFSPDPTFNFNVINKRLIIEGGLKNLFFNDGGLVAIGLYRGLSDETNETEANPASNIWSDPWLQNYATALIKKQWASNMGKYANISLLGGVTLNASEMMAETEKELQELEDQLINEYADPPVGIIG